MEDFDRYLSGEMTDGERQRFEQALASDPALQTELRVREGLHQLRLQKKVEQVAQTRLDWQRGRRWRQWLGIAAAVLLVSGVAFVFWYKNEATTPTGSPVETPTTPSVEPAQPTENQDTTPILPKAEKEERTSPPIAERPTNAGEQPLLRSAYEDLDPFTLKLLDSLLTQTRRLPQKDKNWQKAVQQLATGQPNEAKTAIFQLEKTDADEARWLLGLALLAAGKSEEAEAVFAQIARMAGHPRQAVATAALAIIKE
jgi:TolA-binding protein